MEHPAVSGLVIYAVPDGTRFLFRRLPSPLRPGLRYAAAAAAVAWRTRRYLLQASLECLVSSRLAMEYLMETVSGSMQLVRLPLFC